MSARPGSSRSASPWRPGAPSLLITTSGTAVAELHPAVLEAAHSGVPLIVLSADRPAELRGIGANQTTVQPGIFGAAAEKSWDVPAPDRRPRRGAGRARPGRRGAGRHPRRAPREPGVPRAAVGAAAAARRRAGRVARRPRRPSRCSSCSPAPGTVVVAGTARAPRPRPPRGPWELRCSPRWRAARASARTWSRPTASC